MTRLILGGRNKFGPRKTTISGITFAGAAEAEYYLYLLVQQAGEIASFRRQPRYKVAGGVDEERAPHRTPANALRKRWPRIGATKRRKKG
ncbi:DUF1064 domain-containing protein [Alicyclobacillus kakegawensis]|uniref:DUF1064 domain-containing protein n=1 Tax=Alicyclobacillus kakegawensis TaxID=392012 RepID=UPI00082F30DA|nr:DUF1064 domain-containing protein [Alicyclobacillus kakegawensis]